MKKIETMTRNIESATYRLTVFNNGALEYVEVTAVGELNRAAYEKKAKEEGKTLCAVEKIRTASGSYTVPVQLFIKSAKPLEGSNVGYVTKTVTYTEYNILYVLPAEITEPVASVKCHSVSVPSTTDVKALELFRGILKDNAIPVKIFPIGESVTATLAMPIADYIEMSEQYARHCER